MYTYVYAFNLLCILVCTEGLHNSYFSFLAFVFAAHRATSVDRSRGKANGYCFVEILRDLNGTA